MAEYEVSWTVDIFDAASPREAAEQALACILNPDSNSLCRVFVAADVDGGQPVRVDLSPGAKGGPDDMSTDPDRPQAPTTAEATS